MIARFVSTVPLARGINWLHEKMNKGLVLEEPIPKNHQLMLWWAGLRGAIAFALSFDVVGESAMAIRTTTLVVCVISIMLLGGTINFALRHLKIRIGFGKAGRPFREPSEFFNDGEATDSSSDGEFDQTELDLRRSTGSLDQLGSPVSLQSIRSAQDISNWFVECDGKYLRPFFTRTWRWGERRTYKTTRRRSDANSPTRQDLMPIGSQSTNTNRRIGTGRLGRGNESSGTGNQRIQSLEQVSPIEPRGESSLQ